MTDKEMHPLTVSQCISSDWCRGYNEAVKEANEVINRLQSRLRKEENKNSKLRNERNRLNKKVEKIYDEALNDFADVLLMVARGGDGFVDACDIHNTLYVMTGKADEELTEGK